MAFGFKAVDEVGVTLNTALVVVGDKLGYHTTMAAGPVTPAQLAAATGTGEPYAREWLNAQAAGGYVEYDATTGHYTLPPEQAAALTDPSSPAYLPGFFQIALGTTHDIDDVLLAARNHAGLGWHEHHADVHDGCERFFRTMYNAHWSDLVTTFDALHDMGDPVGAGRHVRAALAPEGTWMVVEPMAGDSVSDNLNPVGRAYYGFSTLLCTPSSLAQGVGLALGTQRDPHGSATWSPRAASLDSIPSHRPRSTGSSKSGFDRTRLSLVKGSRIGP